MSEEELLRVQVEHLKEALEEQKKLVAQLKQALADAEKCGVCGEPGNPPICNSCK